LRASRRLTETLDKAGMSPHARATWAARLAAPSFEEQLQQRLEELRDGAAR
jgi:hypothetical protein